MSKYWLLHEEEEHIKLIFTTSLTSQKIGCSIGLLSFTTSSFKIGISFSIIPPMNKLLVNITWQFPRVQRGVTLIKGEAEYDVILTSSTGYVHLYIELTSSGVPENLEESQKVDDVDVDEDLEIEPIERFFDDWNKIDVKCLKDNWSLRSRWNSDLK